MEEGPQGERINEEDVAKANAKLKKETATGVDVRTDEELKGINDSSGAMLADNFNLWEEAVALPVQLLFDITAVRPKPTKGERPVGSE